jgi:cyclophilin family peptidyl-prolyl cis-trans isomerase/HEAT repeat protein
MIYDFRMRRLGPLLPLLVLAGCASVPREAIRRAQDQRAPDSQELVAASRSSDEAILAMARIGAPAYADALIARLRGSRRELAAWALGQLPPEDKIAVALRPLLSARAPGLRAAGFEALGKAGRAEDEPRLAAGLRDPHPDVRGQAALALFRLRFRDQIPSFSSASVRALRVAFSDPVAEVRWRAVYPFSRYAEPRLGDPLAEECGYDQDRWARLFACRALGLIGKTAPWEELAARLAYPDPLLRYEAVKALGLQGRAEYLSENVYADAAAYVRAGVAEALAAAGDKKTGYKLDAVEEGDSVMVRAAVSQAHIALKARAQAERRLAEDALDTRWWARSRAYTGLGQIGAGTETLRVGLLDADPRVRAAVLDGLAKRPDAAREILPKVLADPDAPVEVVGAALELAPKAPSADLLPGLRRVYDGPLAARYPELADDAADAYKAVVSTLGLTAPALTPRASTTTPVSPWLTAQPPPTSVILQTEKGEVEIALAVAEAPIHSAAFIDSVKKGVYNGSTWHRVVTGFVVQGGDPRGSGWGDAGFSLRDEINRIPFDRGVVGMPKAGKDTGGCQLFITLVPTPHLDGRYTVFGRVTRGIEVVDNLEPGDKIVKATLKL